MQSPRRARTLDARTFRQIGTRAASLDERIVEEIRALISSGHVAPGDRLPPERELAQALNVSRASLREALRRLATLGLVEIRWGQGVFVRSVDLDFVLEQMAPLMLQQGNTADLYAIRRLLEGEAASWAAERATTAERAELEALTADALAQRQRLSSDALFAKDVDQRYHHLIARMSHNQVLVRIMLSLLDFLGEARRRSFGIPGRALRSLEEHQAITGAIVSGNPVLARQRMISHLQHAEAAVRRSLNSEMGPAVDSADDTDPPAAG